MPAELPSIILRFEAYAQYFHIIVEQKFFLFCTVAVAVWILRPSNYNTDCDSATAIHFFKNLSELAVNFILPILKKIHSKILILTISV